MARSVEWKVLFSEVEKDDAGTYGVRAPKIGPNNATNNGGSAGSIYMGTKDLYLTGGQGDTVDGLSAGSFEWYKAAPVRIPAGSGDDVNYSYEKMVALRFVDPGDPTPTTITNMNVWKNAGNLQPGVAVFATLMDRLNPMTDTDPLPMWPESSLKYSVLGVTDVAASESDYGTVVTAIKSELPTHTVTEASATSGWKLFAAPLFGATDPSECYNKDTAIKLSNPDMVAEITWNIAGTEYGTGYTNELLVFVMAVMAGCNTPGDIQTTTPVTIMVEYNES